MTRISVKQYKELHFILFMFLLLLSSAITNSDAFALPSANECHYLVVTNNQLSMEDLVNEYDLDVLGPSGQVATIDAVPDEADAIREMDGVESVEEETEFYACGDVAAPLPVSSWNIDAINARDVKAVGASVALLDSGVDYSESYAIAKSINLVEPIQESNPLFIDRTRHGTMMAGAIASAGIDGQPVGVAQGAEIISIKVLDDNNKAPLSRVVEGIYTAVDSGADVIALPFAGMEDSESLEQAVKYAIDSKVAVIAASGNTGNGQAVYPAGIDDVIAVGATNACGTIAEFTSTRKITVCAPGEGVPVADVFGGSSWTSGTSVACAEVAGCAASIIASHPEVNPRMLSALLQDTSRSIANTSFGQVDLKAALAAFKNYEELWNNNLAYDYSNDKPCVDFKTEAEGWIEGAWLNSGSGHSELADKATEAASMAQATAQIANYSCTHVDSVHGSGSSDYITYFHGAGNYVSSLKYTYELATAVSAATGDSEADLRTSAKSIITNYSSSTDELHSKIKKGQS